MSKVSKEWLMVSVLVVTAAAAARATEPARSLDLRAFDGRASTFLGRMKEAGMPVRRLCDLGDLRVPELAGEKDPKAALSRVADHSGLRVEWMDGTPLLYKADANPVVKEALKTADDVWKAGWSKDRAAVQAILDVSTSRDVAFKRACAEAVLRFGRAPGAALLDAAKTEALVRLALADADWLLKRQAVIAATDLKLADAAEIVERAAGEKNAEIARGAALAAGRLGGEKGAAILEKLAAGGAVEKDDIARVQFAVTYGCRELGTPAAVAILEKLAKSDNAYLGVVATWTAGFIPGPEAMAFLKKQTANTDPRHRRGAAHGWGVSREPGAVDALAPLILEKPRDGTWVPPWNAAAIALGRQGGPEAFRALKAGWDKQGASVEIVHGIGLCGTPEAKAFLKDLANHGDARIRYAAAVALNAAPASAAGAVTFGKQSVSVSPSRPRVFLRADDADGWTGASLAKMRARFRRPDYQQHRRKGKLPNTTIGQTLLWMISGDEFAGLDAAAAALEAVDGGISRARGQTPSYAGISVQRAAAMYDWLHGHGDIDPITRRLMAHHLEGWGLSFVNGVLKGRGNTVFYSRQWGAAAGAMAVALATYGESAVAPEMLDYLLRQFHDEDGFYTIRQAQDGATAGSTYGLHHLFTDCANAVAAVQSATDWDLAGFIRKERGDWLWKQFLFQMHVTYPDGSFLKAGDLWGGANDRDQYRMQVDVVMNLYKSGVARTYANQMEERWPGHWPSDYHTDFVWQYYVFNEPDLKPAPLDEAPRCMVFSPEIDGFVLWRSSWAPDATIVHFHSGDSLDMHGHADQGKFIIYKHKPLADKQGAYIGYGSALHNRFRSAVGANVVIFDNGKNGGGQPALINRAGNVGSYPEFRKVRAAFGPQIGRITKHEVTDQYAHVVGVLDGATPDRGGKNKWTRELLFLDYKYLIVLDRITAAPDVKCHWQLCFDGEPKIAEGMIQYDNAPGRLFCRTLLPETANRNIVPYSWPGDKSKKTQYSVEVRGPNPSEKEQVFLHVLLATDVQTASMPDCSVEKKGNDLHVRVGTLSHVFKAPEIP